VRVAKNITISIPDELAEKISQFPEVNWSSVARTSIENYIETRHKPDLTELLSRLREEKGQEYARGRDFGISLAEKLGYKNLSGLVREYYKEREDWDEIRYQGLIGAPGEKYNTENDTIQKIFVDQTPELVGSSEAFLEGFREIILEIYSLIPKT
jgi:hypothetical protein